MSGDYRVEVVRGAASIEDFRRLCREYAASLAFSLDYQGFDDEMAGLPGKYAAPEGVLLLARGDHAEPLGIVAVRRLPSILAESESGATGDPRTRLPAPAPEIARIAELKRMYVRPQARGLGIGLALGRAAVEFAGSAGYEQIWLDSEPEFLPAIAIYRKLGFIDIPRYNSDPNPATIYMGLRLKT